MDVEVKDIKIVFEIEAEYPEINLVLDDFRIVTRILKNDEIILKFDINGCEPNDLFTTLNDILDGKYKRFGLGAGIIDPDFILQRMDDNFLYLMILPKDFEIHSQYFNMEMLKDALFKLDWDESAKKYYSHWKEIYEPNIKEGTMVIRPKHFSYSISKENYKKSVIELFENYKKLVKEKMPEFESTNYFKLNFSELIKRW
jgi:hypothetical protein